MTNSLGIALMVFCALTGLASTTPRGSITPRAFLDAGGTAIVDLAGNAMLSAGSVTLSSVTGTPSGFLATLQHGQGANGAAVDPATVTALLDGAAATVTVNRTETNSTVSYTRPEGFFPSGSTHTLVISFRDTLGHTESFTNQFTVAEYAMLRATLRYDAAAVDTNKTGFIWNIFQNAAEQENTSARAEAALAGTLSSGGELLENEADPRVTGPAEGPGAAGPNGTVQFQIPTVINVSQAEGENNGTFTPDEQMPGIPGTGGSTDGIAAEIITYIDLPRGLVTMGVNSDDGFRTTAGRVNDRLQTVFLGQFEGGRGAADTTFSFVVEEAGIYGFRTIWYDGGGAANIEWFTVTNGTKVLVNGEGGPKSYRALTAAGGGASVTRATPTAGAVDVAPDAGIELDITAGTSGAVDPASIAFKLDGTTVTPSVTSTGNVTTVRLPSTGLLAPGSVHNAELTFRAGTETETRNWSFTVANYVSLDCALGTQPGSGTDPGFRIRTVQSEATRDNTDALAERQLLDNSGATNIADLSLMTYNGFYFETNVVNYNQDAPPDIGNFTAETGFPDVLPPGIPGATGSTDNFSQEILTYLDLPSGLIRMGVNSDDGFKVTPATGASTNAPVLGIFNGGRGAADTIFVFLVEEAGVYPFRMIWYEGGGGANAEWFTVSTNGVRTLINSTTAGSIKAFRARNETATLECGDDPGPGPGGAVLISRSAADVTIAFEGGGTLQSADSITGPWTDLPGGSPQTVQPVGAAKFYRLKP